MPGIEKTFSRYPQLYSRVGFAHHYRPLSGEELAFVLARHWHKIGLELNSDDFTDACRGVGSCTGMSRWGSGTSRASCMTPSLRLFMLARV
ncbi:hypothetical protein [Rhodococcus sp. NPDC127528]